MKYKIFFHKNLKKDLRDLDRKIISRFFDIVSNKIAVNPGSGRRLKGKYKDFWRYRVGNYRIIYQFKNKNVRILILRFKHRKNVYDDLFY
ncbi:MAG TPA: type II toxin-antitoxin system RelE/ParE family toxin [Candidatus Humimicrobiaceae bacterium]